MTFLDQQFWFPVEWQANSKVKAFQTTRFAVAGQSDKFTRLSPNQESDYGEFNLALHVGDNSSRVLANRAYLKDSLKLPADPIWLEQIHSNRVIDLDSSAATSQFPLEADGSVTQSAGRVCCVMTADCLPVLLCNRQGSWVSAVHAGWRGLVNGIIENAVRQYSGTSKEILAWLGPAISQPKFEVGAEVKQAFVERSSRFESAFKPVGDGKYLANLYQIARDILVEFGIKTYGGNHCTYQEPNQFYSYRRQAITGRMASLIWINNH